MPEVADTPEFVQAGSVHRAAHVPHLQRRMAQALRPGPPRICEGEQGARGQPLRHVGRRKAGGTAPVRGEGAGPRAPSAGALAVRRTDSMGPDAAAAWVAAVAARGRRPALQRQHYRAHVRPHAGRILRAAAPGGHDEEAATRERRGLAAGVRESQP